MAFGLLIGLSWWEKVCFGARNERPKAPTQGFLRLLEGPKVEWPVPHRRRGLLQGRQLMEMRGEEREAPRVLADSAQTAPGTAFRPFKTHGNHRKTAEKPRESCQNLQKTTKNP